MNRGVKAARTWIFHVAHSAWRATEEQVPEVYRWVSGKQGQPNYGMPLSA
ncbi:hypothetical protein A176_000591 [Myxococcus hansupus]|uniref:Uncharacterized protein n=1 Tax=Pseudomyxococcus hansupus TaxID=1297742 RepID=A0A0H4WLR5_9BACT|nr:hypothetical protein A176_000591 [Myxococcus hansupus]